VSAGEPLDEYKIICEFLRSYATLRFLRFTVLLGATGGLIGASRYLHLFLASIWVFVLLRN
jgi:hypothetical protein